MIMCFTVSSKLLINICKKIIPPQISLCCNSDIQVIQSRTQRLLKNENRPWVQDSELFHIDILSFHQSFLTSTFAHQNT